MGLNESWLDITHLQLSSKFENIDDIRWQLAVKREQELQLSSTVILALQILLDEFV